MTERNAAEATLGTKTPHKPTMLRSSISRTPKPNAMTIMTMLMMMIMIVIIVMMII